MKKNIMMRLASFLLVAVLISTSAISGTYAKYVTKAEGKEAARVAEWGVQVGVKGFDDVNDGLFLKAYAADDTATAIKTTVEAEEKVVAPGTKNNNSIELTLTGKPEVAVNVEIKVTDKNGNAPVDVVLPAGVDYTDWTKSVNGVYSEKFENAQDYHPIVFTLIDNNSPGVPLVKNGTLAQIETFLESKNGEYDPNTDLSTIFAENGSGKYTLTWAWDFDANGAGTYDKQDTLLGNIAAGLDTVSGASTAIDFAISISVTQID